MRGSSGLCSIHTSYARSPIFMRAPFFYQQKTTIIRGLDGYLVRSFLMELFLQLLSE